MRNDQWIKGLHNDVMIVPFLFAKKEGDLHV